MKLRRTYSKKEDVPEAAAGLYTDINGTWTLAADLEVDGLVPNDTLEEFRNRNITLQKELVKYEGVDPDKFRELSSREQQIRDAEVKGAERIEERVKERTKQAIDTMEKALQKATAERDSLKAAHHKAVIEAKALELANPFGLRKDAARNLVLLVNEQWQIDEQQQPISLESDGKTAKLDGSGKPMRGTDGLQRFIEKLAKEDAKFLFEGNQGGGAHQGEGRGFGGQDDGEVNPFDPKTLNVTKQGHLVNSDFAKAKRMAAKHGIDLKPSSIRQQHAGAT